MDSQETVSSVILNVNIKHSTNYYEGSVTSTTKSANLVTTTFLHQNRFVHDKTINATLNLGCLRDSKNTLFMIFISLSHLSISILFGKSVCTWFKFAFDSAPESWCQNSSFGDLSIQEFSHACIGILASAARGVVYKTPYMPFVQSLVRCITPSLKVL